jgi:hypothetical protein
MTFTVSYYCPHCETMVDVDRDEYLADKAVTPYPFEGWDYAAPDEDFEDAEGVRFVCGDDAPNLTWRANPWTAGDDAAATVGSDADVEDGAADGAEDVDTAVLGCGEPFYLSFVKFADGEELDPRQPSEYVHIGDGNSPATPRGPRGPSFR